MTWSSKFGGLVSGKWSPFGPRAGTSDVSDADFSYITKEDLDRHSGDGSAAATSHRHRDRPARETDILIFRHKRMNYPVHFSAYSIDDGNLTVGRARQEAAKKLGVHDPALVRMFYKGKVLKDDLRSCKEEGLQSEFDADILCVVSEGSKVEEEGESGSESDTAEPTSIVGALKKKRNRKSKKKSRKSAGDADSPASSSNSPVVEHLPVPSGTHPLHRGPPASNGSTPAPSSTNASRGQSPVPPQTASGKMDNLASAFRTKYMPDCVRFLNSPPAEKSKRDYEHKKLTETIMGQVLLKLDAVETDGDEGARAQRKALVKEVQGMLNKLDEANKQ